MLCEKLRETVVTQGRDHFCNGVLKFVHQKKRCSPSVTGKIQGHIRVTKVKVLSSDRV